MGAVCVMCVMCVMCYVCYVLCVIYVLNHNHQHHTNTHASLVPAKGLHGGTIPSRAPLKGVVVIVRGNTEGISIHVADPSAQLTSAEIEISGRWKGQCSLAHELITSEGCAAWRPTRWKHGGDSL